MEVPTYILDKKNWRIFVSNFFTFHRGDPYDFSLKNPTKIFLKIHKGPPYEKWKNLKKKFFDFFCPGCGYGPPKMHFRSFFKNLYTILNALYLSILTFKTLAPSSLHRPHRSRSLPSKISKMLICSFPKLHSFSDFRPLCITTTLKKMRTS